MKDTVRIAMWSGPRNISTAMLRAWENRADTAVCDEPLYAHYLRHAGFDHPGREEIFENCEDDWRKVVAYLLGQPPDGAAIYYQKHMAHHLLPGMPTDWVSNLSNCFLIRAPAEMLASLAEVLPQPTLADTGLPQQLALFEQVCDFEGAPPPVLDSRAVLQNPRATLTRLCERIGVPFDERMLSWPAGRRATDGVWAPHWYASVERSTGFAPYRPKHQPLPASVQGILAECEKIYAVLKPHAI